MPTTSTTPAEHLAELERRVLDGDLTVTAEQIGAARAAAANVQALTDLRCTAADLAEAKAAEVERRAKLAALCAAWSPGGRCAKLAGELLAQADAMAAPLAKFFATCAEFTAESRALHPTLSRLESDSDEDPGLVVDNNLVRRTADGLYLSAIHAGWAELLLVAAFNAADPSAEYVPSLRRASAAPQRDYLHRTAHGTTPAPAPAGR